MNIALAIIFIAGFAIQQLIEISDGYLSMGISCWKEKRLAAGKKPNLWDMQDTDLKKIITSTISTLAGILIILGTKLDIFTIIGDPRKDSFIYRDAWFRHIPGLLVGALVIGAGTEGANTFLKYIGYVKDGRGSVTQSAVTITPASLELNAGESINFLGSVNDPALGSLIWKVLEADKGGEINEQGCYTAPQHGGTYHIGAISSVDPSKFAIATVSVRSS
jgi:hypothetical protein